MLVLWLTALGALPAPPSIQLEEIADVPADVEAGLLEDLRQAVSNRVQAEASLRDCRTAGCQPKDATREDEILHVLIFGGPTRISMTAERLGRGRSVRASQFIPVDAPNRRALLETFARELFPDVAAVDLNKPPELLAVSRTDVLEEDAGVSALTVGSLIVSGVAFAGAVTFGILAHRSQDALSDKTVYDDEVPGLDTAIRRDSSIALGALGVGLAAGLVAVISEATR